MVERRRHTRIDKTINVGYQKISDSLRVSCCGVNISEGGIRLSVFQRIEPETVLKLWIHFEGVIKPNELIAKVVWLREKEEAKFPFEAGVKFINIALQERNKFLEHIKKISDAGDSLKITWIG